MFIGRERELASLKEFYDKDGIGMTVIYGRRRIGKSTLIAEFVKDKKTIFYTATKVGKNRNLAAKYKVSYIFFSLSGYTEWVENLKDEDVLLLTLDSLYE